MSFVVEVQDFVVCLYGFFMVLQRYEATSAIHDGYEHFVKTTAMVNKTQTNVYNK